MPVPIGPEIATDRPFALLVVEAFDDADIIPAWAPCAQPGADPGLAYLLDQRWRIDVLTRFAQAYGLAYTGGLRAQIMARRGKPSRRFVP